MMKSSVLCLSVTINVSRFGDASTTKRDGFLRSLLRNGVHTMWDTEATVKDPAFYLTVEDPETGEVEKRACSTTEVVDGEIQHIEKVARAYGPVEFCDDDYMERESRKIEMSYRACLSHFGLSSGQRVLSAAAKHQPITIETLREAHRHCHPHDDFIWRLFQCFYEGMAFSEQWDATHTDNSDVRREVSKRVANIKETL